MGYHQPAEISPTKKYNQAPKIVKKLTIIED
jgi:hypothetical protein